MKEFNLNPQTTQNNELLSPSDLAKLAEFNRLKVEVDAIHKKVTDSMLKAMKEGGLKKVETPYFTATYIAAGERRTVDSNKLKSDGLYDAYTKVSPVKESVRINWKEANK